MNHSQTEPKSRLRLLPTRYALASCLLAFLLALISTGCKPDAKVEAGASIVGTYNLVSIDGNEVPCTLQHDGATPTVKSGVFMINADGSCSSKTIFSLPASSDTSREVRASYTRQGSELTMKWEGAGTTTGTVQGDTFTMNNEGMIFAYRK